MVQPAQVFQPSGAERRANAEELSIMHSLFDRARAAFRSEMYPSYHARMQRLHKLLDLVRQNQDRIAHAIADDFGARSAHETRLAEILTLVTSIKYIRKHLRDWMKPQPRELSLTFKPAHARVQFQPLGVVGVIAPWNYPVNLALEPIAYALAAGNRVLLKPSELTPRTALLLQELLAQAFDSNLVSVVTGGVEIGQAFSELPFDHLLYTGSTRVGRLVMQAAAKNLTPVTLELGGKSPAIVHASYALDKAAERIAAGKWFNAGQTCIAPDYVLVPEARREKFVHEIRAAVAKLYPSLKNNPDYSSIINQAHYERLRHYVDDAVSRGAEAIEINPKAEQLHDETHSTHKFAPTLLLNVNDEMLVMQEEIFGPVLPIASYGALDDALRYVNDRPHPLALYYFDSDSARVAHVLEQTIAGGVAINETNLHFAVDDLPFGGVGPSGMGRYHAREGFETFSNRKSVFIQSRWNGASLVAPPYGATFDKLLKLVLGR
jgi:coniferyl-aldehyde dehydrogenase